jgi:hypothetical protein
MSSSSSSASSSSQPAVAKKPRHTPLAAAPKRKKKAPAEMSSKKPEPRGTLTDLLDLPTRAVGRDPRFDPNCGHLNPEIAKKQYGFVYDIAKSEEELLKEKLAAAR